MPAVLLLFKLLSLCTLFVSMPKPTGFANILEKKSGSPPSVTLATGGNQRANRVRSINRIYPRPSDRCDAEMLSDSGYHCTERSDARRRRLVGKSLPINLRAISLWSHRVSIIIRRPLARGFLRRELAVCVFCF